jgi:hypothetical protein
MRELEVKDGKIFCPAALLETTPARCKNCAFFQEQTPELLRCKYDSYAMLKLATESERKSCPKEKRMVELVVCSTCPYYKRTPREGKFECMYR